MCGKHLAKRKKNHAPLVAVLAICAIVAVVITEVISCSQDAKAYEFYDSYSYPVTTSYVTPSKEIVVDNTEEFDVKAEDIEYVDVEFADLVINEPEPVVESEPPYSEEDLDLLARLMTAEMGSEWVPDEVQLYVGSVPLNRMKSDAFPGATLYDVIYQEGQYSPTWTGAINNTPDKRTIENAKKLLTEGSVLPENVVFQANFKQGDGVYYEYYDEILGTTTYFCYLGNS